MTFQITLTINYLALVPRRNNGRDGETAVRISFADEIIALATYYFKPVL